MKQLIRYISLVVVCICTFLLSGCSFVWTMENGDPATPEDIKASVEKEFSVVHPRLVLQSAVVEKEKPFQRNVYVFYDESNGFSFTTNSVVHRPTLPAGYKCEFCLFRRIFNSFKREACGGGQAEWTSDGSL